MKVFRHDYILCKVVNDEVAYQKNDGTTTKELEEASAYERDEAYGKAKDNHEGWEVVVRGCRAMRYLTDLYDTCVTIKTAEKSPLSLFKLEILQEELTLRVLGELGIDRDVLAEIMNRDFTFYGELYDAVEKVL